MGFDGAVCHRRRESARLGAAMGAAPRDEPTLAAARLEDREILAEQPDRLDRLRVEFAEAGFRVPIATRPFAYRRAETDLGEQAIFSGVSMPSISAGREVFWGAGHKAPSR